MGNDTQRPIRYAEILYVMPDGRIDEVRDGHAVHGFEYFLEDAKLHQPAVYNQNSWRTNLLKHLTRESHILC